VISVPYVNGLRRLGARWIRRQNHALEAAGGNFYQYAFTRAELLGALARHGFTPLAVHPYDPARILRSLRRRTRRTGGEACERGAAAREGAASGRAGGATAGEGVTPPRRRGLIARVARQALYTEPALRLLGHMLLVVARRA
jgi:hypothetical protein